MPIEIINQDILEDNDCFGCGMFNPHGLKIEVTRDPGNPKRLLSCFYPKDHMIGFPGITHGGVIYTALDCLASWTPTILLPETKAAWILQGANIRYLRPAHQGMALQLSARIKKPSAAWCPVTVQAQARDEDGHLLVEGRFKLVPLGLDRFKSVTGLDRIPQNWRRLLDGV